MKNNDNILIVYLLNLHDFDVWSLVKMRYFWCIFRCIFDVIFKFKGRMLLRNYSQMSKNHVKFLSCVGASQKSNPGNLEKWESQKGNREDLIDKRIKRM